jgi:hypothetical protein
MAQGVGLGSVKGENRPIERLGDGPAWIPAYAGMTVLAGVVLWFNITRSRLNLRGVSATNWPGMAIW